MTTPPRPAQKPAKKPAPAALTRAKKSAVPTPSCAKKPAPAALTRATKTAKPAKPAAKILASTKKPPLVLAHGFRGSPLGLAAIANELRAAGYEVHVPALPPFAGATLKKPGATLKNPAAANSREPESSAATKASADVHTPKSYARYLRDYCEENRLVRPVLIGHSMGSIIAAATAQRYPEYTHKKLILLSPISTAPPRPIATLSPLVNYLPGKLSDYLATRFLFVRRDRELFRAALVTTNRCSRDTPPEKSALSDALKFAISHSVAEFLDGLQKDIIFIAGTKDRLIHPRATKKLATKHSAALELISGSGHLHNYESPRETARLILKHL